MRMPAGLQFVLILPDGSKSLIPVDWTDCKIPSHPAPRDSQLVGSPDDLLRLRGRWLADGFIAGEQVTPGAPWQIRITDELRARIVQEAPPEYLPMLEATLKLGVSRQTVLQRVKRGELEAVLVRQGRRKGLRIKVIDQQPELFEQLS